MAFPPLAQEQAKAYLDQLVEGYLQGMSRPLLLLPESGGAWLKVCYDAEKDVMLTDEETQQKRVANFFRSMKVIWWSVAKGRMCGINASGARLNRLTMKKLSRKHSATCCRYFVSISPNKFVIV